LTIASRSRAREGFPAHVTVENILDERFARNGKLVRLINKFPDPPNKDVGEGLNTAFAAMKKLQLKDPLITELENSVVVNIRHESLASPEEIVMEYWRTTTKSRTQSSGSSLESGRRTGLSESSRS
jgi:predicted HTH transcriptional regulator